MMKMKYPLLGIAAVTTLLAACDGTPKEEHGAMTPADSEVVSPHDETAQTADQTGDADPAAQTPVTTPDNPSTAH